MSPSSLPMPMASHFTTESFSDSEIIAASDWNNAFIFSHSTNMIDSPDQTFGRKLWSTHLLRSTHLFNPDWV
ncbi:hypothetical protein EG328_008973, partial [Venturia inaequalis]